MTQPIPHDRCDGGFPKKKRGGSDGRELPHVSMCMGTGYSVLRVAEGMMRYYGYMQRQRQYDRITKQCDQLMLLANEISRVFLVVFFISINAWLADRSPDTSGP